MKALRLKLTRFSGAAALAVLGAVLSIAGDAHACGGCFVVTEENTQVSAHRMILSVSMQETTLWDQIQYTGAPESFAWVLPIHGQVEIGLSSDALFEQLALISRISVLPPTPDCPPVPDGCQEPLAPRSTGTIGEREDVGVDVLAHEVVGPYETVQLSAEDPDALSAWLESHGYNVPDDIQPIIAEYVESGFGFLALKLVPGASVQSMRPIRITTPGAGLSLPLRMVAAGTGAVTPITLYVIGDGRYEAANFENFEMDPRRLEWDWDEQRSNYTAVKVDEFKRRGGKAWLSQYATPGSPAWVRAGILSGIAYDPSASGYEGDPDAGITPQAEAEADMAKLAGSLDLDTAWLTRLSAELSRDALADDLQIQASLDQTEITGFLQAASATGEPPCAAYLCKGSDCSVEPSSDTGSVAPWLLSTAAVLAAAVFHRRRKPARRA